MSGYYNPLDLMAPTSANTIEMWGVVVEGETEPNAYFRHKDDAEAYAKAGFFFPYYGFSHATVQEYTLSHPIRKTT